jgi:hypothetical protein
LSFAIRQPLTKGRARKVLNVLLKKMYTGVPGAKHAAGVFVRKLQRRHPGVA